MRVTSPPFREQQEMQMNRRFSSKTRPELMSHETSKRSFWREKPFNATVAPRLEDVHGV